MLEIFLNISVIAIRDRLELCLRITYFHFTNNLDYYEFGIVRGSSLFHTISNIWLFILKGVTFILIKVAKTF